MEFESSVRGVFSIGVHGFFVGEAGKGGWEFLVEDVFPELFDEFFHDCVDVLFLNKAHFKVDLGEVGLAVGSEVFVAEAAGELDVAVKSREHKELFEYLG